MSKLICFFFLIILNFDGYAQIALESPVEHGVYQRNVHHEAQIAISGTNLSKQKIDKIEYKAVDFQANEVQSNNWIKVDSLETETDSTFYGKIKLKQGWYKFTVRYWSDDKIIKTDSLNRVGVGEVFIIVGQSNASGDRTFGILEPQDERVIALSNYYQEFDKPNNISPVFTKMEQYGYIGPSGRTAWFWGNLGDRLVAKLGVPVLFFNAAFGGAILNQWAKSQEIAESNPNHYPAPFGTILNTVLRFGNEFGLRSILWMQGESDNLGATGTSQYFNELKNLIAALRKMSKKPKLTWTISRTSYARGKVSPSIILAQNYIINSTENIWPGPESDLIIGSENRSDDLHFSGQGMPLIAEAWSQSLNNDFFENSSITTPEPLSSKYRNPKFTAAYNDKCFSTNIALMPNIGTTTVLWNTETIPEPSSTKKVIDKGEYWYSVDQPNFRSINSEPKYVELNIQPEAPKIIYIPKPLLCDGDSVMLTSNLTENIIWNNREITPKFEAKTSGEYSLKQILANGCFSKEAKASFTFIKPKEKLMLNQPNNIFNICEGDSILVSAINTVENLNWSEDRNKKNLYINQNKNYWVNYTADNGCPTDTTFFSLKIKDRPKIPQITNENNVKLLANSDGQNFFWFKENSLIKGNENNITTYLTGTYKVYAENIYPLFENKTLVCKSDFSPEYSLIILDNEKEKAELKLWPNPVINKTININSSQVSEKAELVIYSLNGEIIFRKKLFIIEPKITLPDYIHKGIYLVKIQSVNFEKVVKMAID